MTAARSTPGPVAGERGAPAVRIAGLAKSFGDTAAVSDVELTVCTGSFLGLVGPNGAGKTTLLSMAIGLLRPHRGTAFVLGQDVWSRAGSVTAKQLIGALPDGLALPQRLTGTELLTYLGLLRGMPSDVGRDRSAELLDVLDLAHAGRTLIADYSTGMRKKIGLASALLHGPRVLVLDEPFEGVDPVSAAVGGARRADARGRVRRAGRRGTGPGAVMVRILIALRRTVLRNQLARTNPAMLLTGAGLVLLSAVGTIWLGLVAYPSQAAATDVLALVFLLWVGGRVAQSALAGDAVLRPELFSLLPLDRRRLARSLLVVGLLDPAGVFMAIAFGALIARGVHLGVAATVVAVVGVLLSLVLASVLATIAGAVLGPGSRRGHDVGTIVTAVALSVVAVAATLLPALDTALRRGSVPWLADALTWLPTGWGPVAVQAAARGDWLAVFGSLAGLAVLTVAAADWWPAVLSRRMDAAGRAAHPGGGRAGRRVFFPLAPLG